MSPIEERAWIAEAVAKTYRDAGLDWPPAPAGPIPLDRLIGEQSLHHEEVAGLNRAVVSNCLGRWDVRWPVGPGPDESLAGFLYANRRSGFIFVRREDGLPRRRFTAAHELGHYRLHLAPELARRDPDIAEMIRCDHQVNDSGETEATEMERQANRFAAELLMPEAVCRTLYESHAKKYGPVSRVLAYQIASELLVSREAIAWRLFGLGLMDKPSWLKSERTDVTAHARAEAV